MSASAPPRAFPSDNYAPAIGARPLVDDDERAYIYTYTVIGIIPRIGQSDISPIIDLDSLALLLRGLLSGNHSLAGDGIEINLCTDLSSRYTSNAKLAGA